MKKQKLHQLAKFAAVSIVGTIPFVGLSDANAQQADIMPPIVQSSHKSAAAINPSSYSYSGETSKPLAPVIVSPSKMIPRTVSGSRIGTTAPQPTPAISSGSSLLAPIGSGVKQVAARAEPTKVSAAFSPTTMPVRAQGSGSRSVAPAIQIQSPSALTPAPAAPVISGSLLSQGTPSVLDTVPSVAAPNFFQSAPIVSNPIGIDSVVSGCSDCGPSGAVVGGSTGGCATGNCDSCGPNGCYNPDQINCDYGTYGSVSAARRYANLEFLYLTREDGDITNSNFNPLGDFDFDAGWRVTFGQRSDMTRGREISYFGTAGIEAEQTTTNDDNRLNALFIAAGGLIDGDLSAFFNASEQTQRKETTIHSIELNQVRWGWDVLKTFGGLRYIYLDDEFQLDSTASIMDPFGNVIPGAFESGTQRIDTINHLFGGQIGAELFYDIGYRFSISGVGKAGVYVNINEVDNFLENDGATVLDTEDNGAAISTTYDIQLLAHYQIRQTARLRVGYNAMFLGNIATVEDNFNGLVSPFSGFDSGDDDDVFIHGFSFGLEIYR